MRIVAPMTPVDSRKGHEGLTAVAHAELTSAKGSGDRSVRVKTWVSSHVE